MSRALPLFLISYLLWSLPASAIIDAEACGEALAKPVSANVNGLPKRLHVFVWNIEKTEHTDWQKDLDALGSGSNLLLIQEAALQSNIASALPQPLYGAFAEGYTTGDQRTGVLTLSVVPPSLKCQLTSSEPWFGTLKATNITEYLITGEQNRLLVINLHAVNFTVGLRYFKQQISVLAPLLKQHRGPLIVAGDFNTWSSERTEFVKTFMQQYQLVSPLFSPDQRKRFFDQPLDQVYLRNLDLLKATTVKVESSDHNPLLLTLEIPQCSVNCIASLLPYCMQC